MEHSLVSPPTGGAYARHLRTPDLEELAAAQPDKNRRYVQLQPGPLEVDLLDARLGSIQLFRERIDAGMRVEAAPAANLLPFAIILACPGGIRFCGRRADLANVFQATGGDWDVRFDRGIDYVAWVIDRRRFEAEFQSLCGHAPREGWLRSRARPSSSRALDRLRRTLTGTLQHLVRDPSLLRHEEVRRRLEAEILRMSVAVLASKEHAAGKLAPDGRRRRAVLRALEYLTDHAHADLNIPSLCAIAGVSERTLEYGFREQLGVTPVRYLKLMRLNRVRRDLLRASPGAKVTDVALRWGVLELGRFAGEYRRFFGELPSETLRRTAGIAADS